MQARLTHSTPGLKLPALANPSSSSLYALHAPLADPGHYFQRIVPIVIDMTVLYTAESHDIPNKKSVARAN